MYIYMHLFMYNGIFDEMYCIKYIHFDTLDSLNDCIICLLVAYIQWYMPKCESWILSLTIFLYLCI